MTSRPPEAPPESAPRSASVSSVGARLARYWAWLQLLLCLLAAGGVLAYLLWEPGAAEPTDPRPTSPPEPEVRLAGPNTIHIDPDCSLAKKLQTTTVRPAKITSPVLTVTGTVVASLRPADGKPTDYWQFSLPELLTTFTDWQKATADIAFAETQLAQVRLLGETRVAAQEKLVGRLKRLVEAGTDTEKDLAAAQAELIQSQITSRKEVHEADSALRIARRNEAAAARQLQQAGLEPELLRSTASDVDIVMADVPEGMVSRVKLGQGCEAKFFGFPNETFPGKVRAIAPVLSKERRSLRVLFAIRDPHDQLRPGMFADIGLGTDARDALLMPPEGVIHVGRSDYVLVRQPSGDWRVTEVQVGEPREGGIEILSGLRASDQVASRGVILLKPYLIECLESRPAEGSVAREGRS
jgi:cobalt-zinc-cadmium efflux system membrane fusion protein